MRCLRNYVGSILSVPDRHCGVDAIDVIAAVEDVSGPATRHRRGCFVRSYHQQNDVVTKREPYGAERWGVVHPNIFGTQEFIERGGRDGFWDCLTVAKGYLGK